MTQSQRAGTSVRSRPFHVAVYPKGVTRHGNPYFTLYHRALAARGISCSDTLEIDRAWLTAHAGGVDGIHLHWPERFWRRDLAGIGRLRRALRVSRHLLNLARFLRAARRLGMRRIWTVHNLEPHEGAYRWERYGYRLLANLCDIVICHSRWEADLVRRRFRPVGTVIVMPIGELGSAYPAARPRTQVLTELGLDPDLPVVGCLGRLREYKGLDLACAAVERLDGRVQLIVAGVRQAGYDTAHIQRAAAGTKGIVLLERDLSDQEFADLMAASDAQLLPYRRITGSAALLSALGAGRGVVVSDLPYFREVLAGEPDAGVIVGSPDPAVWAESIARYLARPAAGRTAAARRLAARYAWDRSVDPVVAALRPDDACERLGNAARRDRAAGLDQAPV